MKELEPGLCSSSGTLAPGRLASETPDSAIGGDGGHLEGRATCAVPRHWPHHGEKENKDHAGVTAALGWKMYCLAGLSI